MYKLRCFIFKALIPWIPAAAIPAGIGLIMSCAGTGSENAAHATETGGKRPDSSYIRYAEGFRIDDMGDFTVVRIFNPFREKADTLRYLLVGRDKPVPEGYAGTPVIRVPVERIAVTSSLHVGLVNYFDAADRLVAVGDARYIYARHVLDRIRLGEIAEIGDGAHLDKEKVLALRPDVLMDTGNPDVGLDAYRTVTEGGVPVLINSEWMENTPLGRAEWVKLMGALLDRRNAGDHKFAYVADRYEHVRKLTDSLRVRPGVLVGTPYQGVWYMPGGSSFMARLLEDAGAAYPWHEDTSRGSLSFDFETVYPFALQADSWINIYQGGGTEGKQQLGAADARFRDFKAYKTGELYAFTLRSNAAGANDYWESGSQRPDLLLADLTKIFHPELLPDYSLYFYKRLE